MIPIKILIADDHALLRRGLATLLGFDKEFLIIGDAKNGQEALLKTHELRPDVVIMDLAMPVMDGVEATKRIHETQPDTKILILTSYSTSADVSRAIEAGASGALVKDSEDDQLIAAVKKIANGGKAFSPELKALVKDEPHPPTLTERQQEILEQAINGRSSEQIADNLKISTYTVNQHLDTIRKKLKASNRVEAVAIALRKHLLKI